MKEYKLARSLDRVWGSSFGSKSEILMNSELDHGLGSSLGFDSKSLLNLRKVSSLGEKLKDSMGVLFVRSMDLKLMIVLD